MENQNINPTQNNQVQPHNTEEKERDFRNIMLTIVGVFIILAAVSGGTYAYYAFSATNNTIITGTAATADLSLTVNKIRPSTATGPLVPQRSANTSNATNPLKSAIDAGCVDGNNNVVCHVYKIAVKNLSTATVSLDGSLTLSLGTSSVFSSLRWYTLASGNSTTVPSTATYTYPTNLTTKYGNQMSTTTLGTNIQIASNSSQYYFIVVWIEEIDSAQNSIDRGSFIGTVSFTDPNGEGLTSTFTG